MVVPDAIGEFALGAQALERFIRRKPLRRDHERAFGVRAIERTSGKPEGDRVPEPSQVIVLPYVAYGPLTSPL